MIYAAVPAVLVALFFGAGLYGLDLLCAGTLQTVTEGYTGKTALLPLMAKVILDPILVLKFIAPIALGLWAFLLANARLRALPALVIALPILAIALPVLLYVVLLPSFCALGLSGQALALAYAAITLSLAGLIRLLAGRES